MLDYDGTLTPIVKNPVDAVPSATLIKVCSSSFFSVNYLYQFFLSAQQVLEWLCSDEKNVVYIISGRDRDFLQQWLGYLPVGLSCEHGIFFRYVIPIEQPLLLLFFISFL